MLAKILQMNDCDSDDYYIEIKVDDKAKRQAPLAEQIENPAISPEEKPPPDLQYYAIVFSAQNSHMYIVKTYSRKASEQEYKYIALDGLDSKYFVSEPSSADDSFDAAICKIVEHIRRKASDGASLLEFFAPDELLHFNWGRIQAPNVLGDFCDLGSLFPYLARPLDRFRNLEIHNQRKKYLKTKHDNLVKGTGKWIVHGKNPPALLYEDEFVAIKQINDIKQEELSLWCKNVTMSMVPLALWWTGGNIANIMPADRCAHLDTIYDCKLANHNHSDPVPSQDDRHYQLAFDRNKNWSAVEPDDSLVSNLVLLLDHPDLFPRALVAEGRQLTSP